MGNPNPIFIWVFSVLLFGVWGVGGNEMQDLQRQVRSEAYKVVRRKRTGVLYNVSVVPSGITAEVVRLRSGSLRRRGVNIHEFTIPKGALVQGNPRKILMIYMNFGHNYSYISTQGYTVVAPVVGILVYKDSVIPESQPELKITSPDNPISIYIPNYVSRVMVPSPSCALLNSNGAITNIFNVVVSTSNICQHSQLGFFSLVIPQSPTVEGLKSEKGSNKWKILLGALVGGTLALLALFLLIVWGRKEVDNAKIAKMEKLAENEETLQTSLIGISRAPTAAGTRTKPLLENEDST